MKRIAFALCVAAALSLTGCASMWKTMGVATEKSVAARDEKTNARLDELKRSIDDLSVKVAASQNIAEDVARIQKLLGELQGQVDKLPQDTLKKLAEVLDKAAAELEAPKP
jgi:uncharacterized protein YukE